MENGRLTPRERQVLAAVRKGYTERQAARLLNVSVRTVHTHAEHISRKLLPDGRKRRHRRTLAELVLARRAGLI